MNYVYQCRPDGWWKVDSDVYSESADWDVSVNPGAERCVPDETVAAKLALMGLVQGGAYVRGVGYKWGVRQAEFLTVTLVEDE